KHDPTQPPPQPSGSWIPLAEHSSLMILLNFHRNPAATGYHLQNITQSQFYSSSTIIQQQLDTTRRTGLNHDSTHPPLRPSSN
ncbi:hypothetical protein AAF712_004977, partial [Marasmius tenuissimus]